MKHFPDNFKCVLWNNRIYFVQFYTTSIDMLGFLKVHYLFANKEDIKKNNAYSASRCVATLPSEINMKEVVKLHFRDNLSFKNHNFEKDTFEEFMFKDLPENVQDIFRRFESHEGFDVKSYFHA